MPAAPKGAGLLTFDSEKICHDKKLRLLALKLTHCTPELNQLTTSCLPYKTK